MSHTMQIFSLRQTDGEHEVSRITTSPLAHKVGKDVSWAGTQAQAA